MKCPKCSKEMKQEAQDIGFTLTREFYACVKCEHEHHARVTRKKISPKIERKMKMQILKDYFDHLDVKIIERKKVHVFDTSHGIWGCSSMLDLFELFENIKLHDRKKFVDLGSGDGRIALLASLFTEAHGIEGDREMHDLAEQAKEELRDKIPELDRCSFTQGNFKEHDLSNFDTLYTYTDHAWGKEFEEKLKTECNGILFSLENIFAPEHIKKGKTIWVGQTPVVTYPLNEEFIFSE